MTSLRFGSGKTNAKLKVSQQVLSKKLGKVTKVYTFTLPSGYTCPFAKDCLSKADQITGKITDGPETEFRCFAASSEARSPQLRKLAWSNFTLLRKAKTAEAMQALIQEALPQSVDGEQVVIRIHVGGDFFNQQYLQAWISVAKATPETIFYAYTKSLPYLKDIKLPENFRITASRGGKKDELIETLKLREARVVYSPEEAEALKLEIDHDDSHAALKGGSFALLLHGTQPKGTPAADALRVLRIKGVKHSYGRK